MNFNKFSRRQLIFQALDGNVYHHFFGHRMQHHIIHHSLGIQQVVIKYLFNLVVALNKKMVVLVHWGWGQPAP